MYNYRVAFMIGDKQLNVWFASPVKFDKSESAKAQLKEQARIAVQDYLEEARQVPKTGHPEALALWPNILPMEGPLMPLDAFEFKD